MVYDNIQEKDYRSGLYNLNWITTTKSRKDMRSVFNILYCCLSSIPSDLYAISYMSEKEKLKIIFPRHRWYSECDWVESWGETFTSDFEGGSRAKAIFLLFGLQASKN